MEELTEHNIDAEFASPNFEKAFGLGAELGLERELAKPGSFNSDPVAFTRNIQNEILQLAA